MKKPAIDSAPYEGLGLQGRGRGAERRGLAPSCTLVSSRPPRPPANLISEVAQVLPYSAVASYLLRKHLSSLCQIIVAQPVPGLFSLRNPSKSLRAVRQWAANVLGNCLSGIPNARTPRPLLGKQQRTGRGAGFHLHPIPTPQKGSALATALLWWEAGRTRAEE